MGFLDPNYTASEKWSKDEEDLLYKYYKDFTGEELHNIFLPNRTNCSIESHASILGIAYKDYETKNRANIARSLKCSEKLKGRIISQEARDKISATKKEYYKTHDGWWKGGILPTYTELRSDTKDWFNESMKFCGYKCVITGGEFDNVHHTTAFREIVDEVFKLTNVPVKQQVCDYTDEEFQKLRDELKDLHIIYGYGACINKEAHKLFHDTYGYVKFSPFDFLDFLYQIDIGEFDEWFVENNLQINLNYKYIKYLESTLLALAESA